MRNKLKYEDVFKFFKEKGCELLESEYKNNSTKMKFKCHCGNIDMKSYIRFSDSPNCSRCSKIRTPNSGVAYTYNEVKSFVESNSDCKLLSDVYKNNSTKLKFRCACGEVFETTFAKFKNRGQRQCYSCGVELRASTHRLTFEEVKAYVEEQGVELLSKEYVNARDKLVFRCECGEIFETELQVFKRCKKRCNSCSQEQSKLSLRVENFLIKEDVDYKKEYMFDDCVNVYKLPFDYAVFKNGQLEFLIETDGEQHFRPVEIYGGEEAFARQQYRDNIKNKYCEKNNIKLIRIPYFEINRTEEILQKHLVS